VAGGNRPQVAGTAAVSVATHDQRTYVRSGNKAHSSSGCSVAASVTRHDMTMTVLDRAGAVLAEKRLQGKSAALRGAS